jgi:hypothetical protein
MPEARLQRTREAYPMPKDSLNDWLDWIRDTHLITDEIVPETDPKTGITTMRRIPRPFQVLDW